MGTWNQTAAQKLVSACLAACFQALPATLQAVIGNGVVGPGLLVTATSGNSASLSVGEALCGTICQLATAALLSFPAGTWDVWACATVFTTSAGVPVLGTYPNSVGVDTIVPTVVAHGTTPAALGCLLATVVSTGTALTSINNAPAGRNSLPGPYPAGTNDLAPQKANFITQPNGTATAFTLVETPNPTGSLVVYKSGLLIDPTAYTLAGDVVTFATAPLNTDTISAGLTY